jgi:hypothetical protein
MTFNLLILSSWSTSASKLTINYSATVSTNLLLTFNLLILTNNSLMYTTPPEDDYHSIDHNPPPSHEINPPSIDNDQLTNLQQEIIRLWAHINTPPPPQTDELAIALDRITALESRNKSLEQDLSIALRSNLAYQRQLEKLSVLLQKPPPPHSKRRTPPATKITAAIDAITALSDNVQYNNTGQINYCHETIFC